MNILKDDINVYIPAVSLERAVNRRTLHLVRFICFITMTFSGVVAAVLIFFTSNSAYTYPALALFLISFGLWVEQILLYAYHNSYFFRGLNSVIGLDTKPVSGTTYDVAKAMLAAPEDVTKAFILSRLGSVALLRSGIPFTIIDEYIVSARRTISASEVVIEDSKVFTLIDLGTYLLTHDPSFKTLLASQGINTPTFIGALNWVVGSYHQEKRSLRWWSKDNLSQTQGLGREWTYGIAYSLNRYTKDIKTSAVYSTLTRDTAYASEKVSEIEMVLAQTKASNVLLIGEPGVGKIDLVMEVKRRIEHGLALDAITGKQIVVLDTNHLFAAHKDKNAFEATILDLFDEALRSGNIIIVIENLSQVIREAESLGVFLPQLIDEYLSVSQLQVIATDTPGAFHTYLEPLGGFTRRFSEILIEVPDLSATTRLLQGIAIAHEYHYKTLFTYGALEAISSAADRYIVEGVMPDKAITLLVEVAAAAGQSNIDIISTDFVFGCISKKTGIPVGPIQAEERDLLLHLEERLHQQVIGQDRAIDAIARTMRRARIGIQSSDKPIGSFLFFGPTGVGKTETAKALANVFFGSETSMHRIDMSEYSGTDALERLIGNGAVSGTLCDMLREHPYAVLLIDEFEKSNRAVQDLFLQILDEGIFTDGRGEKVNARNSIIIATSNAGSSLIMRTVEQRKELAHLTDEIISHIIRKGIFRPELINRFDSTIIFEPLNVTEQTRVASLMLGGLYDRIRDQGFELKVETDLLEVLVAKGYNPEFGARPMQRMLQNVIEEKVAQKIITGEVQKGDQIILSKTDFTEKELSAGTT